MGLASLTRGATTRLVKHHNTVFKVKLTLAEGTPPRVDLHEEMEEVVGAVIYMVENAVALANIQTDHFLVLPALRTWRAGEKLGFRQDGEELDVYRKVIHLTFNLRHGGEGASSATLTSPESPAVPPKGDAKQQDGDASRSQRENPQGSVGRQGDTSHQQRENPQASLGGQGNVCSERRDTQPVETSLSSAGGNKSKDSSAAAMTVGLSSPQETTESTHCQTEKHGSTQHADAVDTSVKACGEKSVKDRGEKSVKDCGKKSVKDCGEKSVKDCGEKSVKDRGEKRVKDCGEKSVKDCGEKSVKDCGEKNVKACGKKITTTTQKSQHVMQVSPKRTSPRRAVPAQQERSVPLPSVDHSSRPLYTFRRTARFPAKPMSSSPSSQKFPKTKQHDRKGRSPSAQNQQNTSAKSKTIVQTRSKSSQSPRISTRNLKKMSPSPRKNSQNKTRKSPRSTSQKTNGAIRQPKAGNLNVNNSSSFRKQGDSVNTSSPGSESRSGAADDKVTGKIPGPAASSTRPRTSKQAHHGQDSFQPVRTRSMSSVLGRRTRQQLSVLSSRAPASMARSTTGTAPASMARNTTGRFLSHSQQPSSSPPRPEDHGKLTAVSHAGSHHPQRMRRVYDLRQSISRSTMAEDLRLKKLAGDLNTDNQPGQTSDGSHTEQGSRQKNRQVGSLTLKLADKPGQASDGRDTALGSRQKNRRVGSLNMADKPGQASPTSGRRRTARGFEQKDRHMVEQGDIQEEGKLQMLAASGTADDDNDGGDDGGRGRPGRKRSRSLVQLFTDSFVTPIKRALRQAKV